MVAIQVRDISDESRDALAAEAERRGQSLQMFLHDVLEREAASARNIAWVLSKRSAQRPPNEPSTTRDEIRRLNEEHTARILTAFDERHR
ncbi:MAG: hypothetical protein KF727_09145 [Microbacteriaceae bacterium]|nr:hypothetical protein [Microbacteriaceae bacterium]